MDGRYPIEVARNKTANGGDEWFLLVGDEMVPMPGGVGIFTEPGKTPAEMLPRLLARAASRQPKGYPPPPPVVPSRGCRAEDLEALPEQG